LAAEPQLGGIGDHLAQLGIFDGFDTRAQLAGQRGTSRRAPFGLCRGALNLLTHPETHRSDRQLERLEALEQLVRQ
jgi:hypothetical protein